MRERFCENVDPLSCKRDRRGRKPDPTFIQLWNEAIQEANTGAWIDATGGHLAAWTFAVQRYAVDHDSGDIYFWGKHLTGPNSRVIWKYNLQRGKMKLFVGQLKLSTST